jgi:hypothetical protein
MHEEEMKVIFITRFILYLLMNIATAMEDPMPPKIDPDIKRIIHTKSPCSFHNHLRILDEIEKNDNGCPLLENKKVFIFNGLADYLHSHGLELLQKWQNDPLSLEEIRKICHLCIEDDWRIDAWEDDEIYFSMHVAFMRQNYRYTLEDFAFYTFFKPCFDYYAIANEISNRPYEYEQKIETAKSFFRTYFPGTTLVGDGKSQEKPANDCPPGVTSTKKPNVLGIISQKKLRRTLSGKHSSLLYGKCSSPLPPRISKKPLTARDEK